MLVKVPPFIIKLEQLGKKDMNCSELVACYSQLEEKLENGTVL